MSARYWCPSSAALRAICSIVAPPSDQSECRWRSPTSAAWIAAPGPGVGCGFGLEPGQVLGRLSGQGLLDDAAGARSDPGQRLEATLRGERAQLVDGTVADRVGGAAERLFLVASGPPALEQRGDAIERLHRVHHPERTRSGSVPERKRGSVPERISDAYTRLLIRRDD